MDEMSLAIEMLFELFSDLKLHRELGLADRESHLQYTSVKRIEIGILDEVFASISFFI
jgi:hypothetical protein